ncbi:MAG: GNAT family N-acetyltransferase [Rhodospirillaceae bacterium]|nr:GNAT family N-acetyltransferase [Rhodospirillaceae bacterium]
MSRLPAWLADLRKAPLRTRRLILRPVRRGDERLILPAVEESLEQLVFWLPWATPGYDLAECRRFVRDAQRHFAEGRNCGLLMFTRRGDLVGGAGLHPRGTDDARYYEIGYWVRTRETGRGYATEATKALMRCALKPGRSHRVEIRCDPRNRASLAVIRKAGLAKEGHLRKVARDSRGRLIDLLVFAKTR